MTGKSASPMPPHIARFIEAGFARWKSRGTNTGLSAKFDPQRIPVAGARHVRVWGVQVDDERELPGHERTQIADEELWEIQLVALNGSTYAVDSSLLDPVD